MIEIKTFSQALPILKEHGITPTPLGNRLWSVGAMQYDKGGIIALARSKLTPAAPAALSPAMQSIARNYLGARQRAGDAWLETARYLAEARSAAKYGEWKIFLEATQTSADIADRLLAIHEQAERDPQYRIAVQNNFLNVSTAYELTTAPPAVRAQLLDQAEPPTRAQIREAKRESNSAPARTFNQDAAPFWQALTVAHPTAHLWTQTGPNEYRAACGMMAYHAIMGSTDGGHCSSCVRATWPQNQAASAINRPDGSPVGLSPARMPIPPDLPGWHWMSGKAGTFQLTNGDYQTRIYDHPHHAIVGARNYLASQQPAPIETDDSAIIAEIRAKAASLGLGVIWEDDTVILHWPDEDIDQLLGMGYQDALYWLEGEGVQQAAQRQQAAKAAPAESPAEPIDSGASDRQAHIAKEARDKDRLFTARANIAVGNIADARQILSEIEVATYARDQLLRQIARDAALAFHNEQRARLKNFSAAAMISQATFTQALDHIEALLNCVVME